MLSRRLVRLSTRGSLLGISKQVLRGVSAREMKSPVLAALTGITLLATHACSAVADDVYTGKTINVYIGSAPGAGRIDQLCKGRRAGEIRTERGAALRAGD